MAKQEMTELAAEPREVTGKATRHLRRQGLLPANVYGHGKQSLSVQMNAKDFERVLNKVGMNALVSLVVDGGSRPVLVRGVARDRITGVPTHVDLQEVALDEPIKATVPIVLTGESPAAKGGALVIRLLDHVTVEGLPADLPSAIHADVSSLEEVNATLHLSDIGLPEGIILLVAPDEVVAKVAPAVVGVEEEVAEAEEAEEAETPAKEGEAPEETAGTTPSERTSKE